MPLASTLWPISGRSVVVMPGSPLRAFVSLSQVVAEDEVRHATGLLLALHLVGQPVDGFGTVAARPLDRLHLGHVHVHPDPAAHPKWRREADPVEAVVEDDGEAVNRADLPEQAGGHA